MQVSTRSIIRPCTSISSRLWATLYLLICIYAMQSVHGVCVCVCWCVSVLKAHHHYYFISKRQPSGTTQHVSSSSGIFSNSSVDTVREAANALSQDTVAETEAQIITSNTDHFRAFGS